MSSEISINVHNLDKSYDVYRKPIDRLKQFLLPKLIGLLTNNIKKFYEEFWALKSVSFKITSGEAVAIIGRNGSGKSTLLQLICGTLNPTNGSVSTKGRVAALLELGAGFNPEFTGVENIYLSASLLGLSRVEIEDRYQKILDFADIGDFVKQPVKTYSSGMYVRLAFAIAVHVDADILIIDEALAVGDIFFQSKCLKKIEELMDLNNLTLLFVSHDLVTVQRFCKKAIWLENGRLVKIGDAVRVCDEYVLSEKYASESVDKNDSSISSEIVWGKKNYRFGTGEFKIESVVFNHENDNGNEVPVYKTGDKIELTICMSEELEKKRNAQLSVTIYSEEGLYIFGTATLYDDISIDSREIKFTIFEIPLLRGTYELSVGIWNQTCTVPYDLHERCYKFNVLNDRIKTEGIVEISHEWSSRNGFVE